MEKMERFLTAARGEKVDTPPVGCWIHFGSALWEPELAAKVHIEFQNEYDWDYLKVMDDYRFPTAGNISEANDPSDLKAVGSPDLVYENFDKQKEVLKLIRAALPGVPLVDTVFSPFQTVIRTLGDTVVQMFKDNPDIAHEVLGNVSDRLVEFLNDTKDLAEGIHYSVNGASADWHGWGVTQQEFEDWIAPYDKKVLDAAAGRVRIMHVHGYDLTPTWVDEYPVEVMSWSHNQSQPTLEEVAGAGKFVPMGGLNEVGALYWPPSKVLANVMESRRKTGDKIIVAPGCTVHSDTPPSILKALVSAARMPLS
ncbi:uroporphyrinogen decarboxylase family protein [Jonesiaceae bacterium BS-20]|uniref:Uroporphyrinogen decarboxylase family protein n=1 Tax=Jonesiaceae bacterium BS-20 TaxID=3120821 RepID=A0AAU7DV43_9MICO